MQVLSATLKEFRRMPAGMATSPNLGGSTIVPRFSSSINAFIVAPARLRYAVPFASFPSANSGCL